MFFPNVRVHKAKEVIPAKVIGKNNDFNYFWFGPPNLLLYQQRFKVTIYCSLDFQKLSV